MNASLATTTVTLMQFAQMCPPAHFLANATLTMLEMDTSALILMNATTLRHATVMQRVPILREAIPASATPGLVVMEKRAQTKTNATTIRIIATSKPGATTAWDPSLVVAILDIRGAAYCVRTLMSAHPVALVTMMQRAQTHLGRIHVYATGASLATALHVRMRTSVIIPLALTMRIVQTLRVLSFAIAMAVTQALVKLAQMWMSVWSPVVTRRQCARILLVHSTVNACLDSLAMDLLATMLMNANIAHALCLRSATTPLAAMNAHAKMGLWVMAQQVKTSSVKILMSARKQTPLAALTMHCALTPMEATLAHADQDTVGRILILPVTILMSAAIRHTTATHVPLVATFLAATLARATLGTLALVLIATMLTNASAPLTLTHATTTRSASTLMEDTHASATPATAVTEKTVLISTNARMAAPTIVTLMLFARTLMAHSLAHASAQDILAMV